MSNVTVFSMKIIGAAKFKEQCLSLLDALDDEGLLITKRGKPVARLVPFEVSGAGLIGALSDKIAIKDELIAATSIVHNLPLLTRDQRLRASKRVPLAR
jgi:prevent-host-death family protein